MDAISVTGSRPIRSAVNRRERSSAGGALPLPELRRRPELVTPIGAQWTLPAGFRTVMLRPTPYLRWSVVWRTGDAHPALRMMLDELSRLVAFDAATGWLPAADRADLP